MRLLCERIYRVVYVIESIEGRCVARECDTGLYTQHNCSDGVEGESTSVFSRPHDSMGPHQSPPNGQWSAASKTRRPEAARPHSICVHFRLAFVHHRIPFVITVQLVSSDTHNRTDTLKIPDGDVLLHAGDFSDTGQPRDIEKFGHFLTNLPHQHKVHLLGCVHHVGITWSYPQVVIAGNHDLTFDTQNYDELYKQFRHPKKFDSIQLKASIRSLPNVTYLEDSGTTINGIKIWGSPW